MTLRRMVLANFIGQGWTAASGFLFVPLYIKLLGVQAYGVIGFFAVLQASFSLLDLGMTPTISRQLARYSSGAISPKEAVGLVRGLGVISLAIGALIIAALVIATPYLSLNWFKGATFDQAELKAAFYGIAIVIGLRFCEGLFRGALVGLERQVLLNILLVIFATMRNGGVVVAMLLWGATLPIFFAYQAALSILVTASLAIMVRQSLPRIELTGFSLAPLKESLGFSAGMFAIAASSLIITQADKIILSRLVPITEYGYYMLAVTLASALPLVVGPIAQAVYPRLVRYIESGESALLADIYHLASQAAAALILPMIALSIFYPAEIISGWSGNADLGRAMTLILPLMVVGTGANALYWLPYHAQLAMGWTRLMAKYNAVSAVLVILALTLLAKPYGTLAGGGIWLVLNVSYLAILVPILHRRFLKGQVFRWYIGTLGLPAIAVAIVAAVARVALPAQGGQLYLIGFLMLTYLASAGAAALAAPNLRQIVLQETRRVLTRLFRTRVNAPY